MSGAVFTLYFDIDGTLMIARGAGRRAFSHAFKDVYNLNIDISHVNFAGATDLGVLNELLKENDVISDLNLIKLFFERLAFYLEESFKSKPPILLPGVMSFLHRTKQYCNFALVTGNTRDCSSLKIRYANLHDFFNMNHGGYGDDNACRNQIARIAIERTGNQSNGYLLGDTPKDVQAAKANNLRSVALCTGAYKYDDLIKYKPDIILDSFEQAEALLSELIE